MSEYEDVLSFLYGMLPMYQRVGRVAYKKDLTNTLKLLRGLHDPHRKFKTVHVAGTNGKGTSAHAIAAILQSSGYKTGLYTSPHLRNYTERIRINGREIPESYVVRFVREMRESIREIRPSFFEFTVALGFSYFADQQVDIAVVETGLGGRLDSTNVIVPEVSLITNIGYDHTELLGDTLEGIAYEKAGIIKRGVPVVIGTFQRETYALFKDVAKRRDAELILAHHHHDIRDLPEFFPYYFRRNLPGVIAVVRVLRNKGYLISALSEQEGLKNVFRLTGLKGRCQVLQRVPLLIADVSHNAGGLRLLMRQVNTLNRGTLHIVFGTVEGRNLPEIFSVLPRHAHYYWTQAQVPRSLSAHALAEVAGSLGYRGRVVEDVNKAIEALSRVAHPDDLILITGSTFVVGEITKV